MTERLRRREQQSSGIYAGVGRGDRVGIRRTRHPFVMVEPVTSDLSPVTRNLYPKTVRSAHAAVLAGFLLAATTFAATTPVILSIDPKSVIAGSSSFTMTVNGANFVSGALVRVNGSSVSTTFVSSSKLTAVIPFAFLANPASLPITATNPGS